MGVFVPAGFLGGKASGRSVVREVFGVDFELAALSEEELDFRTSCEARPRWTLSGLLLLRYVLPPS